MRIMTIIAGIILGITLMRFLTFSSTRDLIIEENDGIIGEYTVVINAFRRDDRLEESLSHYSQCVRARYIYVIWNDVERDIPSNTLRNRTIIHNNKLPVDELVYRMQRVVFFVDESNVISNRFIPRHFLTEAVFSVDDDMLYDCDTMASAHDAWNNMAAGHPHEPVGVGFAARHVHLDKYMSLEEYRRSPLWRAEDDAELEQLRVRYYEPSDAYRSGIYNTVFVTKGAFLSTNLFAQYFDAKFDEVRKLVDAHTTGEDMLMSAVCWHLGVHLLPLHYRNLESKLYHYMFTESEGVQKKDALSRRTISWRPMILSHIIQVLLKLHGWDGVANIPESFAEESDEWMVQNTWTSTYGAMNLSGDGHYLSRMYLFDGKFFGLYR